MFVRAYLETATAILSQYGGEEPLPAYLKKFFAQHKKFGSRDRRQISHICFCYLRTGHAFGRLLNEEVLLAAIFLCSSEHQPILAQLKPEWNAAIATPINKKITEVSAWLPFDQTAIFPYAAQLSTQIEPAAFANAFLVQPHTYLRIRPGKHQRIKDQLDDAGIDYRFLSPDCVGVPPGAKLDELLMLNRDAVVQDRSSQQVLSLLEPLFSDSRNSFSTWDCCAASGGKSIQLHDLYPNVRLTVSDIRASIIANLKKRFEQAGINNYNAFVGDVAAPGFVCKQTFDLVLCDAPCSGSGTWGRTPEQLFYFKEEKIQYYAQLQQTIATRAAQQVKADGFFLYITCSVFAAENEAVVQTLAEKAGLRLLEMRYFKGYGHKADTLFAAVFRRS